MLLKPIFPHDGIGHWTGEMHLIYEEEEEEEVEVEEEEEEEMVVVVV